MNTKGQQGTNIPNDLHMEHLNRLVKTAIGGLGGNKIERVLRVLSPLLDNFDSVNGVAKESGRHGKPSEEKILKKLF